MSLSQDDLDAAFRASSLFQQFERLGAPDADPLPDAEAKRHHFVPQFLLRNFIEAGRDRLFQLDVQSGRTQAIKPGAAASRRHFYSVIDEEGNRDSRVESYLGVVESHAARALNRLLDDPAALEPGDRATLAYFFGLFGVRTPQAAERTAAGSDVIMKMMLAARVTHPDVFARDYREAIGEGPEVEIEELRLEMLAALEEGRVHLDDPRAHAIGLGLQMSADLAAVIFLAEWTLCRTEGFFITSDAGLAMYDPTPRFPWSGNGWFSSPGAQTTIPLSRTHCLLITPGDDASMGIVDAEADKTDAINLRTYGWASDYIYGHSQEAVAQVRRLAKRRRDDVVRPRPARQMILIDADPADTSLADEHARRGWPRQFYVEGQLHDYLVIGIDGAPVETGARASQLARQRATSR